MCLGGRYGAKTLVTITLLLIPFKSFAYVGALQATFEAVLGASLVNSGVPEENARNEAKEVSKWAFGDSTTGRRGRFSSDVRKGISLEKLLSERVVEGIDFTDPHGEKGTIFNIAENGTEADRKLLEKVINTRFQTQGELVFKRKKRVQQILNFCQDEGDNVGECDYVVAPDWYSALELFNYRSKRPVNTDGDYVYSNTPLGMYSGVYYHSAFDLRFTNRVVVDLGFSNTTGKNEELVVYGEDYINCYPSILSCPDPQPQFIEDTSSFSNILLSFNYVKQITDISPDLPKLIKESEDQHVKEQMEANQKYTKEGERLATEAEIRASVLPLDPAQLEEYLDKRIEQREYVFNYQYPVLKIREETPQNKNIEDIKHTDTDVDIISTNSSITEEESTGYSIDESSLADIYTGVLRSYVSSNGGGSGGSLTPNLFEKYKSDSYFSSSDVSSVIRSLGISIPRLRDFSDGRPDTTGIPEELPPEMETVYMSKNEYNAGVRDSYINARPKIVTYGADDDEETKHFPIGTVLTGGRTTPILGNSDNSTDSSGATDSSETGRREKDKVVAGSVSGSTSGNSRGSYSGASSTGSSETSRGDKDRAGTITGGVANSATNSNSASRTETVVIDKAAPKEESEADKSEFFLPTLEDISARDILQPFFDLKTSILSELQFSMPSGDCPRPSVELFGKSYSIEAHCTIFDELSSVISSFAAALWLILAFRIVFSA